MQQAFRVGSRQAPRLLDNERFRCQSKTFGLDSGPEAQSKELLIEGKRSIDWQFSRLPSTGRWKGKEKMKLAQQLACQTTLC